MSSKNTQLGGVWWLCVCLAASGFACAEDAAGRASSSVSSAPRTGGPGDMARCPQDGYCDGDPWVCPGGDPDCDCFADGRCNRLCVGDDLDPRFDRGPFVEGDASIVADPMLDGGVPDAGAGLPPGDPDCGCLDDGICNQWCAESGDPDCGCGRDSFCNRNGSCDGGDPDCGCAEDGECNEWCSGGGCAPGDPECDPDCCDPDDGECDTNCGAEDPDCGDEECTYVEDWQFLYTTYPVNALIEDWTIRVGTHQGVALAKRLGVMCGDDDHIFDHAAIPAFNHGRTLMGLEHSTTNLRGAFAVAWTPSFWSDEGIEALEVLRWINSSCVAHAATDGFCDRMCGNDAYTLPSTGLSNDLTWHELPAPPQGFTARLCQYPGDYEDELPPYPACAPISGVYAGRQLRVGTNWLLEEIGSRFAAPSAGHNSNNDADAQWHMFEWCQGLHESLWPQVVACNDGSAAACDLILDVWPEQLQSALTSGIGATCSGLCGGNWVAPNSNKTAANIAKRDATGLCGGCPDNGLSGYDGPRGPQPFAGSHPFGVFPPARMVQGM